jgi:hypothetical protein
VSVTHVGNRLTAPQVRVLSAVALKGYISVAAIADSAGLGVHVTQSTLDALTRRSLVFPVDLIGGIGYMPMPRAKKVLAEQ